jgi:hypothetical protein
VSKIDPLQLVLMRCLLRFEANGGGNTMVKKESRSIVRHSKIFRSMSLLSHERRCGPCSSTVRGPRQNSAGDWPNALRQGDGESRSLGALAEESNILQGSLAYRSAKPIPRRIGEDCRRSVVSALEELQTQYARYEPFWFTSA